jgi:uncharacterized glyoxalase superfamily protein PhnB
MLTQMFPMVVVADPATAAQWYRTRLAFEPVASLGWYEHLRAAGGRELGFLAAGMDHQPEALRTAAPGLGFALSFEVTELDRNWSEWGCHERVVLPPTREEWGQYHFMVHDGAGLLVDVIEAVAGADGGAS